jgi:trimeric autotransporter adhesin
MDEQIKVHGTTVIASFKQEVERSDQHMRDLISHLNGEGGATGAVSGADNSTEVGALTAGESLEKSETNSLLTEGDVAEEPSGNVTALVTSTASLEVTAEGKTQSLENGTIKAIDNKNSSENGSNQADLSTGSLIVNATAQNSSAVTGLVVGKVSETAAKATATATTPGAGAAAGDKKNVLTPLPDGGNDESTSKDSIIVSTSSTSTDTLDLSKKPLTTNVPSQNLNTTLNNTSDHVPRNETQNSLNSTVTPGATAGVQDTKKQNIDVNVTGNTEQKKVLAMNNSSQSTTMTSEDDDEKTNSSTKSPSSPSSTSSTSSASNVSVSVKSTSSSTLQNDSDKTKKVSWKDKIKHDDIQDDTDMKSNDTSTDITTTQPDLKVESKILNSTVKLSISSDVNAAVTVSVSIKKQEAALGDKKVNVIPTAALKGSDDDTTSSVDQLQNKTAINVLNGTTSNNMTDAAAAAAATQGSDVKKNASNDTVDATVLNTTHTSTSTNTSLTSNTSEVSQVAADKLKSQQNEVKSTANNDTTAGVSGTTNATESATVINDDKEDKSDVKVNDKDLTAVSTVAVTGLKDENTIISTGVAGSNPIASLSALGILESPILPTFLSAPPASVRATTGPTAGFSPQCLETLRFSEFQATMANKLKQRAEADKSQVPIHSQDNVFRQLMLKIKTLEMNYAIIEMYSAQVSLNSV